MVSAVFHSPRGPFLAEPAPPAASTVPAACSASAAPAMAAPAHELAQPGLLLGAQAVVEIAEGGDHGRAAALQRGGLGVEQRLRAGAVEGRPGDQGLKLAQQLLGHADISTTAEYLKQDNEDLVRAGRRVDPLAFVASTK